MLSQHVVPTLLRAEDSSTSSRTASATGDSADPIHPLAHFWCRVGRRGRQPDPRQHLQVEEIVAHVGDIPVVDLGVANDLLVGGDLALHALLDNPNGELRGAVRRGARRACRQEPDRQPGALRPDNRRAVADVEAFDSDPSACMMTSPVVRTPSTSKRRRRTREALV